MAENRALVVEDYQPLANLLDGLATKAGFATRVVPSAAEARRRLRGGRFDVLITDADLPDGDARDVIDEAEAEQPGLPAIVVATIPAERLLLRGRAEFYPTADHRQMARRLTEISQRRRSDRRRGGFRRLAYIVAGSLAGTGLALVALPSDGPGRTLAAVRLKPPQGHSVTARARLLGLLNTFAG